MTKSTSFCIKIRKKRSSLHWKQDLFSYNTNYSISVILHIIFIITIVLKRQYNNLFLFLESSHFLLSMAFVISTFHGIILQMKHRKRISLYNYQSPTITQPTDMFSMPIYSINDNKKFFIQILQKETQKRLLFKIQDILW